jgi:heterodisulfide reductase subunit C
MDHTPRMLIAMVNAGFKDEVLASNAYWTCAACHACSEACPKEIYPADMMYVLRRYSLWKGRYREGLVGPEFSRRFVKTILKTGKSYEPGYAPAFILEGGFLGLLKELKIAFRLLRRGRLPLVPSKIKRVDNFRRMLSRIIPLEGIA